MPQTAATVDDLQPDRAQVHEGLSLIKSSILMLLYRKRRGLSNAEIARALDLTSDQNGRMRNMLSWSILGILVKEGKVRKSGNLYFLSKEPVAEKAS